MVPLILVKKTDPRAVLPSSATPGDVGYDLTAISLVKEVVQGYTYMYDTGICIEVPPGYYTEIVPRSSIVKTGFMLSNGVGIIDPHYRGSLKICLTRVVKDECLYLAPPTVPFVLCQLLVKKAEYAMFNQVDELSETVRGAGGFGSTDSAKKEEKAGHQKKESHDKGNEKKEPHGEVVLT